MGKQLTVQSLEQTVVALSLVKLFLLLSNV